MKQDFRKIIKREMKHQNINTPKLARMLELNAQVLYNYLSGRSQMYSDTLERVFDILKIKLTAENAKNAEIDAKIKLAQKETEQLKYKGLY